MTNAFFFISLSYGIVAISLIWFGLGAVSMHKKFIQKLHDEGFLD